MRTYGSVTAVVLPLSSLPLRFRNSLIQVISGLIYAGLTTVTEANKEENKKQNTIFDIKQKIVATGTDNHSCACNPRLHLSHDY
jgi:hypothetical protein